jgi:GNAT superfamily N-acetyltransferase
MSHCFKEDQILVRVMIGQDVPAVHRLLNQLGYDLRFDEAQRRFDAVIASDDHSLLVAELDGCVVGLLHVYLRPALEKPPEAVVQALVVDMVHRKRGIGRTMMSAAEHWTAERGFRSVALTSQIARQDAHAFYTALGYRLVATSHLLRKEFGSTMTAISRVELVHAPNFIGLGAQS